MESDARATREAYAVAERAAQAEHEAAERALGEALEALETVWNTARDD
jgi:hypothetical protein